MREPPRPKTGASTLDFMERVTGIAALPSATLIGFGLRPQPATGQFWKKPSRGRSGSWVSTGHPLRVRFPEASPDMKRAPWLGLLRIMERVTGIEPAWSAWKALVVSLTTLELHAITAGRTACFSCGVEGRYRLRDILRDIRTRGTFMILTRTVLLPE